MVTNKTTAASDEPKADDPPRGINVAVLRGNLSREPRLVDLPSGDRLARLDLTVRREGEQTETVPIQVADPSATVLGLEAGNEVVVTGIVRRRYYRAGGTTASQTEVVADRVILARHVGRVATAVDRALSRTSVLAQQRR